MINKISRFGISTALVASLISPSIAIPGKGDRDLVSSVPATPVAAKSVDFDSSLTRSAPSPRDSIILDGDNLLEEGVKSSAKAAKPAEESKYRSYALKFARGAWYIFGYSSVGLALRIGGDIALSLLAPKILDMIEVVANGSAPYLGGLAPVVGTYTKGEAIRDAGSFMKYVENGAYSLYGLAGQALGTKKAEDQGEDKKDSKAPVVVPQEDDIIEEPEDTGVSAPESALAKSSPDSEADDDEPKASPKTASTFKDKMMASGSLAYAALQPHIYRAIVHTLGNLFLGRFGPLIADQAGQAAAELASESSAWWTSYVPFADGFVRNAAYHAARGESYRNAGWFMETAETYAPTLCRAVEVVAVGGAKVATKVYEVAKPVVKKAASAVASGISQAASSVASAGMRAVGWFKSMWPGKTVLPAAII